MNPGAEDFGDIGASVQGERHQARQKGAVVLADFTRGIAAEQEAVTRVDQRRHQGKVNQQNLHKQRGAAKKGHVGRGRQAHQKAHGVALPAIFGFGQPGHAHQQADQRAQHHGNHRDAQRHLHALNKQRHVLGNHAPTEIHTSSICKIGSAVRPDGPGARQTAADGKRQARARRSPHAAQRARGRVDTRRRANECSSALRAAWADAGISTTPAQNLRRPPPASRGGRRAAHLTYDRDAPFKGWILPDDYFFSPKYLA